MSDNDLDAEATLRYRPRAYCPRCGRLGICRRGDLEWCRECAYEVGQPLRPHHRLTAGYAVPPGTRREQP